MKRWRLTWWVWIAGVRVGLGQLGAGDVAVVAYDSDAPDAFAWVAFRDVPAHTAIHFTNSSVSNGWFRWGDHLGRSVAPGPLIWSHTNMLPAGTVVTWLSAQKRWTVGVLSGGAPSLSASGDQITVYTGTIVSNAAGIAPWVGDCSQATLLYALNFANAGWDNVNGGGPNTSFVPSGLSTASFTAVHVNMADNGYYSGPGTGTVEVLRSALARSTNWTTSDSLIDPGLWPVSFFVRGRPGLVICIQ